MIIYNYYTTEKFSENSIVGRAVGCCVAWWFGPYVVGGFGAAVVGECFGEWLGARFLAYGGVGDSAVDSVVCA